MEKLKLVIVEDNTLTSQLLATIFSSLDFEIKEIARGDEALPYFENHLADVIILDLELPGMNGDAIYAGLKSSPRLREIPIVPFTAQLDDQPVSSPVRDLIRASVVKTGRVTPIVYKANPAGFKVDITKEVIDEVGRALIQSGRTLPAAMIDYYQFTHNIKPEDLKKHLGLEN